MQLKCTIRDNHTGQEYRIRLRNHEEGTIPITIGSAGDCTIVLKDPDVAPRHAEIQKSERSLMLVPLAGDNTSHRGQKIPVGGRESVNEFEIGKFNLRIAWSD